MGDVDAGVAGRDGDPVAVAAELAERVLRPQAARADVEGVRREVVDVLAAAGLLALGLDPADGGSGASPAVQRAVTEVLAGADGATWFVTVQHSSPLSAVARSANTGLRDRELPGLASGRVLAGVAVAHLRRPGEPAVRARRTARGWRLDGRVGWATSWGLADRLLLAGLSDDDEVVQVLLPARDQPGLAATAPLPLAVMGGTGTVRLAVDGLQVDDGDVVEVVPAVPWREADRLRTANVTPAVLGLVAEVARLLEATGRRREDASARALAQALTAEVDGLRTAAYALVDEVPAHERLDERLALRGQALELGVRASAALVAATGGSALALDAAPQRLAREALFHLVQAQTPPVRRATLTRMGDLHGHPVQRERFPLS